MTTSGRNARPVLLAALGFFLAFPSIALGAFVYLRYGHPPVATADSPFPQEEKIAHVALNARIERELVPAPHAPTAEDLSTGAEVYVGQCAVCHGTPGHAGQFGKSMYPQAPQLWERHRNGVVGVSDDPANVTYWKVANGIRLAGMPSFTNTLTSEQMWAVSFLVAQADKPLPPAVASLFAKSDTQQPHISPGSGSPASKNPQR